MGLDGWLSYTAVTPRASLQSDANKDEEMEVGGQGINQMRAVNAERKFAGRLCVATLYLQRHCSGDEY